MADDDVDVVIVGAGFAGAVIANKLAEQGKRVVILEAGDGVSSNINDNMSRFYKAQFKVPESPYTPKLLNDEGHLDSDVNNPRNVLAGRPSVLDLDPKTWKDPPGQHYLVQTGPRPFSSTYERGAGGTSHWLGTSLRFLPNDFRLGSLYGSSVPEFVDWPIGYDDLVEWYGKAEAELGVSANVEDQAYLGIYFPAGYTYPMPGIPESLTDKAVRAALKNLKPSDTAFLNVLTDKTQGPTEIKVLGTPAARNSQPYRNRRACAGNTNCIPICPIQAKYDPTITLNEALSHKNVKLMSHTVASEIVLDDELHSVSAIKYIRYSPAPPLDTHAGSISAKIYVIAANAIETPRLLLMSTNDGRTPDGVANNIKNNNKNNKRHVGRHLMDHPYYVAWGQLPITPGGTQLWPYRGPLITSGIEDLRDGPFRGDRAAFRVDIGNEGWNFVIAGLAGSDPNTTAIDFVNGVNRTGLNRSRTGMFGPALVKALNDNITRQFRVGFLVEQTPNESNRVNLSWEFRDGLGLPRPKITYDLSPYTKRGITAAKRMKDLLFRQMNATDYTTVAPDDPSQLEDKTLNYTGAGHIMGTYRMGFNSDDSVVDSFQCSHDHDNLYLVGSGTFPTGATANPTLTLVALALRTADRIVKRV